MLLSPKEPIWGGSSWSDILLMRASKTFISRLWLSKKFALITFKQDISQHPFQLQMRVCNQIDWFIFLKSSHQKLEYFWRLCGDGWSIDFADYWKIEEVSKFRSYRNRKVSNLIYLMAFFKNLWHVFCRGSIWYGSQWEVRCLTLVWELFLTKAGLLLLVRSLNLFFLSLIILIANSSASLNFGIALLF